MGLLDNIYNIAIVAKAFSTNIASYAMDLEEVFNLNPPHASFWMKYGTPYIHGKPLIWSKSQWKGQKLRDVTDRVDGNF